MQRNLTGPWWEWVACERHSLLEWALAKKQKEKEKGEDEKESLLRESGRDTSTAGRCLSSPTNPMSKVDEQRAAKERGAL
jgi:hypothetical protein